MELAAGPSTLAFDRYSPLAASEEILRRTMSPIAVDRVSTYMRDKHQRLPEQSIDLAEEKFSLYVPLMTRRRFRPTGAGYLTAIT